ncbi:MAG: Eco57I restriction-modification methylase domain-containing protein [Candidatus Coatesbacteria bacterium]|nr:Eco57I restriction-modification methylase domain-containing protein [Candidatus Coatesbacteria bacterium]
MKALRELTKSCADLLLPGVEAARRDASLRLEPGRRVQMGQFFTPAPVATFMAGMIECREQVVRVLDPGAGVGSLSAALVAALCRRRLRPDAIALTAYEIEPVLLRYLRATFDLCRAACKEAGIRFEGSVFDEDFLEVGARTLAGDLFTAREEERFDCAILNPPYRKIRTESRERKLLRAIGLETSNLYTGFLGVTARLLAPGGEIVAITPRSFCNGPYFEPFRRYFLREMRLRRVHVFDARDRAFPDDEVLQENVVFWAQRATDQADHVVVSSSLDPAESNLRIRTVKHDDLVRPCDPHVFIHIVPDSDGDPIRQKMARLKASLVDLGLAVSTGRVVDFRVKALLRARPVRNTVPLIHACHFQRGFVEWPNGDTRKPNALSLGPSTDNLLIPAGHYVLVKRFTAKEERRRIVAAVYDPARVPTDRVAFENHLNYYHLHGASLPATVVKGLAAFLSSTLVDSYFRHFSGHTQVNATDLRSLRYPACDELAALGGRIGKSFPRQEELDRLVEEVVFGD